MRHLLTSGALVLSVILSACETVPKQPDANDSNTGGSNTDGSSAGGATPISAPVTEPSLPITGTPNIGTPTEPTTGGVTVPPSAPVVTQPGETINISESFRNVRGWDAADFQNALKSFQRGCSALALKDPSAPLHSREAFGTASDWATTCNIAQATPVIDNQSARSFFESEFLPVDLTNGNTPEGTITGYYQPEIQARRIKDAVYSEPILTAPTNAAKLTLARSQINESTAPVIAYGRPIEVFFMQIQGSGVLVFQDGTRIRAAYDANNGRPYSSIGRILVERGAFTLEQASKQRIEDWMTRAGPVAARELMNKNTRYIFFKEETILPGEGPKGAMRVPLTDMASIAVDPSHYPYGIPVWLEAKMPSAPGDYIGAERQILVITQDTGKAIRGPFRADLYFGSGTRAGDMAGVMKHTGRWTVLLPFHLAVKYLPGS